MYEMTLANIQYHVLYLQEHLNFSYVRVWNLFSKRLMISDGQTKGSYNFMMIDQVLDFLLKNKLRPFFDLGRKPNVIKKADDNIIRYEEEFIEFRSREIWEDCMVKLFRHLIDRYGIDEMSNWIFELSRDGVHQDVGYYEDADYAFFDAYQFSYRLIRECIPSAKIGGAASIIYSDWEYLTDFYQKCVDADCVPDFVSQIIFPYIPFEKKQNHQRMRISQERDTEVQQVQMMRELMQKAGVKDCKLYVSEFNNSVSNRNMLNDSCFRGAYYCKKIGEIAQYVDMICIMAGSDWINSYMDFNNPANGGVGMLTKDTICKPAYWAVAFLNMLGSKLLIQSDYYIATKNSSGEYFILCQNFKWFHKKYYLQPENIDLRHDMDLFFEDDAQAEIGIRISDLEEGQYVVKSRRMNREEGSLLAEWAKLDFTSDLTRQDIRYLRTASFPRLQIQKQQTKDSALQISIKLQPHEVCMIHIYRLDRAY